MARVVLDTNVLVSALLSPGGPSHRIVLLALKGDLQLVVDARIRQEYQEVLTRGRFRFSASLVTEFLGSLLGQAQEQIALPLAGWIPDEGDRPFMEVAVSGEVEAVITGNVRHYLLLRKRGTHVMTPADFLRWWALRQR